VAEDGGNRVRRFDGKSLEIIARGSGNRGDAGDIGDGGPALAATLNSPTGVAFAGGKTYVLDEQDFRIRVIDAAGQISTLAGSSAPTISGLADATPVAAPQVSVKGQGLAADAGGRVYWSNNYHRQVARVAGGQVSLVAGKPKGAGGSLGNIAGSFATTAGPALEAVLGSPFGLAVQPDGGLLVADAAAMRIWRVTDLDGAAPQIAPFAGVGAAGSFTAVLGGQAEPASVAKDQAALVMPGGVCTDAQGNVFVAELGTTSVGLMTTLTGDASSLDVGAFPPVAARVRKIGPDGTTTIVAGPGSRFFADPSAEDALVLPTGLAVLPDGRLAIIDTGANLIRLLPKGTF
jgi:serine/threonine-protein kinase